MSSSTTEYFEIQRDWFILGIHEDADTLIRCYGQRGKHGK
jgi:hypothetical protein